MAFHDSHVRVPADAARFCRCCRLKKAHTGLLAEAASIYTPRLSQLLPILLAFLHVISPKLTHSQCHWILSASPRPPCVCGLGDHLAPSASTLYTISSVRVCTYALFLFPDITHAFSRGRPWRITGFARRARGCGWSHLSYSGQARSSRMLKFKTVLHLRTRICLQLHTGQSGNIVRGSKQFAL